MAWLAQPSASMFSFFFLPIPFLYALRINSPKKYGLMGVFLLRLFTTVCSILRMTQIPVIATGSGNSTLLVLWGNIEMNVGVCMYPNLLMRLY